MSDNDELILNVGRGATPMSAKDPGTKSRIDGFSKGVWRQHSEGVGKHNFRNSDDSFVKRWAKQKSVRQAISPSP